MSTAHADTAQRGKRAQRGQADVEAAERHGRSRILPDKKQIVAFLINKGQGFRDLLFHPTLRALVGHVLGPQ